MGLCHPVHICDHIYRWPWRFLAHYGLSRSSSFALSHTLSTRALLLSVELSFSPPTPFTLCYEHICDHPYRWLWRLLATTIPLSLSFYLCVSLSRSLSRARARSLSLSLFLSLNRSLSPSLALSFSLFLSLSFSMSRSLSRSLSLTHTLSLYSSLALFHFLS